MNYNELKETTNKKLRILKKLNSVAKDLKEFDYHLTGIVDTNWLDELYDKTFAEIRLLKKEEKYIKDGYKRTISFRELQKINLRKTYSLDVLDCTYNEALDKLTNLIHHDFEHSHFEVTVRLEKNTQIIGIVTLTGRINEFFFVDFNDDEDIFICDELAWYMPIDNTFAKVDKERLFCNISVSKLMLQN